VTVFGSTIETPGVAIIVVVEVTVLFELTTDVTVCQIVVEYVTVALAAIVVVTRRVDVDVMVVVPTTDVTVETKLVFWRFLMSSGGGGK
jgi:hypothetical protein